jgi:predicted transcriptional regulator
VVGIDMLSSSQKKILKSLLDLYKERSEPIKSENIAKMTGRSNGTIRNMMISLRALQLVESIAGPKGGYIPTAEAFELFRIPTPDAWEEIPVIVEGKQISASVSDIGLSKLPSPADSTAEITVSGDVRQIKVGERIIIGPTPKSNLLVKGEVIGLYPSTGKLLIEVSEMATLPKVSIGEIATEKPITVKPDTPITTTAEIFAEKRISAVPIVNGDDELVGLFTSMDLAKMIVLGKLDDNISDALKLGATTEPCIARPETSLVKALRVMDECGLGRVVIVDENERVIGIVTRTDLLKTILEHY